MCCYIYIYIRDMYIYIYYIKVPLMIHVGNDFTKDIQDCFLGRLPMRINPYDLQRHGARKTFSGSTNGCIPQ